MRPQRFGTRPQASQWLSRVSQPLHVGEVPARLHGHNEPGRKPAAPCIERGGSLKPIEAGVELHGIEVLGVVLEPTGRCQSGGIKAAAPVSILPP